MKIEFDQECPSCGGTGLYVGMAERDGAAVVCSRCEGTGKYHFTHEYEEFTVRKNSEKVIRVYQANPGIMIGTGKDGKYNLEDFGGITKEQWEAGKKFGRGTENRRFTCPAWWYQSVDYKKKPKWKECQSFGSFTSCQSFGEKDKCWAKFDGKRK